MSPLRPSTESEQKENDNNNRPNSESPLRRALVNNQQEKGSEDFRERYEDLFKDFQRLSKHNLKLEDRIEKLELENQRLKLTVTEKEK